jgi:hypothetical protein
MDVSQQHLPLSDLYCPRCLQPEVNPCTSYLNIQSYKVLPTGYCWSFCLRCKYWFNDEEKAGEFRLRRNR